MLKELKTITATFLIVIVLLICSVENGMGENSGAGTTKSHKSEIKKVLNKAEIDSLLKEKWGKMKNALLAGDIEKALEYYHDSSKEKYRATFEALGHNLKEIFSQPEKLILIEVTEDIAKYKYITTEKGGDYSAQLTFIKDSDGQWKILEY